MLIIIILSSAKQENVSIKSAATAAVQGILDTVLYLLTAHKQRRTLYAQPCQYPAATRTSITNPTHYLLPSFNAASSQTR